MSSVRPSVHPSVRPSVTNKVILPVYAGLVRSRWSFASSNKNAFHTLRALQPGPQPEVYPLSTATTPSSQLARTCRGVDWVAKLCKCNGAGWPRAKQACTQARTPSSTFSKSEGFDSRCPTLLSAELETQTSSLSRGRSKRLRKLQRNHIWML